MLVTTDSTLCVPVAYSVAYFLWLQWYYTVDVVIVTITNRHD